MEYGAILNIRNSVGKSPLGLINTLEFFFKMKIHFVDAKDKPKIGEENYEFIESFVNFF